MNMTPLESSAIKRVGYDGRRKVLRVQFPSNTFAQYKDVPPGILDGILAAESPGEFFNANVRHQFQIADEVE